MSDGYDNRTNDPDVNWKMAEDERRYRSAMHAMQSGVLGEMEQALHAGVDPATTPTSPKHLRVGVNSALINDAALVRLLVEKGIITQAEYLNEVANEAERERFRYEARLGVHLG